ncbi:MAG TPA: alpha/beta fold hydrolase [Candidatus Dormibacteraeota bacterium]|nr:alpha/beta fold hydrolase [Candidatus Dormibacteraeota bacterium]
MATAQSYDLAGGDNGDAIVFLHGMRVTRRMWQPQMEALASEFRLIAMDLPGHGALRSEPFHVEQAVEQIAQVVDQAANGRALIVGISLGGYVVVEFGARYPQKAAGLVIASACVEPRGWYNVPYKLLSAVMSNVPESWLSRLNRALFLAAYGEERAQPLVAPGFYMRGGAASIREIMGREFGPKLAAYPGPVLLLNGEMDLGFRIHEKRFLALTQQGQLAVIPRAFHIVNIDQPQLFSQAVRRFGRSLPW